MIEDFPVLFPPKIIFNPFEKGTSNERDSI